MALIPLRPLLETTDKYHFAQGAFNVNAVAQAKAVIEVHEMFRSAAILQGADLANGLESRSEEYRRGSKEIWGRLSHSGSPSSGSWQGFRFGESGDRRRLYIGYDRRFLPSL